MNYPLWSLPAKGLLIAAVAITHVFISHFAVGGGLFLVLAERKARREGDPGLLAYVREHSRFFALLTLVGGAITGVGIWFTIGVVHPEATATLITAFVWAWAIEWAFFATEIAAALVYYYGWDRLTPRVHLAVGWIYFGSAWMSLAVINGMLSFMLTPGRWLATHAFLDGFLNPGYLPSVVARTAVAIGLAGIYALLTASRLRDPDLKEKVARYAGRWLFPMAIVLPLALVAFLVAVFLSGVPIGEPLGGPGAGIGGVVSSLLAGSASGNRVLVRAVRVVFLASGATLLLTWVATRRRPRRYGLPLAIATMACAFAAMGAGEWTREDLRKPYVIGGYMFVNGVRAETRADSADPFSADALEREGVLPATAWRRAAGGEEVFRLLCSTCHTIDGYLGVRPRVAGRRQADLEAMLTHLDTWRGRRMPPFTGTEDEKQALAAFLERLGAGQRGGGRDGATAEGGGWEGGGRESLATTGTVVPRPVPLPLPAAPWLLSVLLTATFVLHLLTVNLVVGGSVIGVASRHAAAREPHARRLAALITTAMPVLIAAAVSMGVGAFLFLQVLYGRVFFTAAVLLAVPWLLLVPVLMGGYAAAYGAGAAPSSDRRSRGLLLAWLVALAFLVAAFGFANLAGLMLRPSAFLALFRGGAGGWHLDLGDPTLVPRFLHIVLGSLAVAGLAVTVAATFVRRTDAAAGEWMARQGLYWFAGATVANFLPGFWWLAALPRETLLQFMGRDALATACFVTALFAAIAALGLALPAAFASRPAKLAAGAAAALCVTVVMMVLMRDFARTSVLAAAGVRPVGWVVPQWGPIAAFALVFAGGVATVWWMVWPIARSAPTHGRAEDGGSPRQAEVRTEN